MVHVRLCPEEWDRSPLDVSPEFGRLPDDHELTLYRIVQEGLTNIHLHSESKTARIGLERRPNEVVLTVADEGHGSPPAALAAGGPESSNIGVGIAGIRERLRQLGGRLHIQTGSRGTTLTANLPLGQVNNGQTTLSFPVDDHDMIRRGLRSLVEAQAAWEVLRGGGNGARSSRDGRETQAQYCHYGHHHAGAEWAGGHAPDSQNFGFAM